MLAVHKLTRYHFFGGRKLEVLLLDVCAKDDSGCERFEWLRRGVRLQKCDVHHCGQGSELREIIRETRNREQFRLKRIDS